MSSQEPIHPKPTRAMLTPVVTRILDLRHRSALRTGHKPSPERLAQGLESLGLSLRGRRFYGEQRRRILRLLANCESFKRRPVQKRDSGILRNSSSLRINLDHTLKCTAREVQAKHSKEQNNFLH